MVIIFYNSRALDQVPIQPRQSSGTKIGRSGSIFKLCGRRAATAALTLERLQKLSGKGVGVALRFLQALVSEIQTCSMVRGALLRWI